MVQQITTSDVNNFEYEFEQQPEDTSEADRILAQMDASAAR